MSSHSRHRSPSFVRFRRARSSMSPACRMPGIPGMRKPRGPVGSTDPDKGVETSSPVDGSRKYTRKAREYGGRQPVTDRERRGHDAEPVDARPATGSAAAVTGSHASAGHHPAGAVRPTARGTGARGGPAAAQIRDSGRGHALVGRCARRRRRDHDVRTAPRDPGGQPPLADPATAGAHTGDPGRPDPRVRSARRAASRDRVGLGSRPGSGGARPGADRGRSGPAAQGPRRFRRHRRRRCPEGLGHPLDRGVAQGGGSHA
jgi:hypothetical protein